MITTATADRNEQRVRAYVTAIWQDHDFQRAPEFVADSITYSDPTLSEPVSGVGDFVAFLRDTKTAFPDFHVTLERVVATDDVVMAEWTFRGTHAGPFDGIPPTRRAVAVRGMSVVRLEDEMIVDDRAYWDTGEVAAQLGLDFPAIIPQLPKLAWGKVVRRT